MFFTGQINRHVNPGSSEWKGMSAASDMCVRDVDLPPGPAPAFLEDSVLGSILHGIFFPVHAEVDGESNCFVEQLDALFSLIAPVDGNGVEENGLDVKPSHRSDSRANDR